MNNERRIAEEALRESEQRWRSLIEALPQLVWSATPDGACDYVSPQWTKYTGVAESELLGMDSRVNYTVYDNTPAFLSISRGPWGLEYFIDRCMARRLPDGVSATASGVPISASLETAAASSTAEGVHVS